MDGGHVWSVAACGSNGAPNDEKRIFNSIMLRFRPIAPKPVADCSSPGGGVAAPANQSNGVSPLPGKRNKRKYVRIRRNSGYVSKNNGNNDNNKSSEEEKLLAERRREDLENVAVGTLQLMPEKKDAPERSSNGGKDSWCKNVDLDVTVEKIQILEENRKPPAKDDAGKGLDLVAPAVVESWVTVESVTGTCMEGGGGGGFGCTDVEKVKNLETDTCPGFISDGYCRVRWVNDAFKRMVVINEEGEVLVWLKVKEGVNIAWCYSYPAFTCGVRLQYTWRNEKCTKMVPCDVWRLDCGGFAWRLDVKAALSLGL